MRHITSLAAGFIAVAGLSGCAGEVAATDYDEATEAVKTAPAEHCARPGIYEIDRDTVVVCSIGGYAKIGDIKGNAVSVEIGSLTDGALPPVLAHAEGGEIKGDTRTLNFTGLEFMSVGDASQALPGPKDVSPDCDGFWIDPASGDAWMCSENVGLLLPAVQKVRDAASKPASKPASAPSFVLVPRRGTLRIKMKPIYITSATEAPQPQETPRGFLFVGVKTMAAKAKADILIESLEADPEPAAAKTKADILVESLR